MICSTPDCTEPAEFLVRSDGLNSDGVMVTVMWRGFERFDSSRDGTGMHCEAHARETLSRLPLLATAFRGAPPAVDDDDADIFTHG